MTAILNRVIGRRQLIRGTTAAMSAAGIIQLSGCGLQDSDSTISEAPLTNRATTKSLVPSAIELVQSESARNTYRQMLSKVFGHGLPKNRRDMHALVDSMKLSEKTIGHFAYTIPGDSLEHIKIATAFWASEFNVGPFMVLESTSTVSQDYYPILPNGKRADDSRKQRLEWPAFTALCKPFPDYYLELNLQTKDTASTYRDMFSSSEGGFHHFAVITKDFKGDKALMESRFQPSSALITSVGATYFDARSEVDCMFELLETNKLLDFLFLSSYELAKNAKLIDYVKTFNIIPTDISKPSNSRGLTADRIVSLIKWADKEGPLADSVDFSKVLP